MFRGKDENPDDERRAMIVIGIFVVFLIAFMAIAVILNMPPPVKPAEIIQNTTQNATFVRNVTMVR